MALLEEEDKREERSWGRVVSGVNKASLSLMLSGPHNVLSKYMTVIHGLMKVDSWGNY